MFALHCKKAAAKEKEERNFIHHSLDAEKDAVDKLKCHIIYMKH